MVGDVVVAVTISHMYSGDITIDLRSPSGFSSRYGKTNLKDYGKIDTCVFC